MPAYEGDGFDPPAPIARALVRGPAGTAREVPLLVDPGADVSALPRGVIEDLGAQVQPSRLAIELYNGHRTMCDIAELSVQFLGYRFQGLYLVGENDYGILGRNILNLLSVALDGPGLTWSA